MLPKRIMCARRVFVVNFGKIQQETTHPMISDVTEINVLYNRNDLLIRVKQWKWRLFVHPRSTMLGDDTQVLTLCVRQVPLNKRRRRLKRTELPKQTFKNV